MAANRRCPNGHERPSDSGSCPICGAVGGETAVTVDVPTKDLPPSRPTVRDDTASVPGIAPVPVPGYEFLGELGRGGMGVVFRARQVKLNRVVALKMVLSGELAGVVELARFRAEAEAAAQLQHPNIVQLYEYGEARTGDGTLLPYFALEYVSGGSLADRLDGTPQSARPSAELIERVARAMHYAHTQGVIHRDLKPGNVLLSPVAGASSPAETLSVVEGWQRSRDKGTGMIPKITDFGLAKRVDSTTGHTQSGAILGTPQYMAPEQAAGKSKRVGPGTDIYALGAILYELITGRPPFQGETHLETILQVTRDDPISPRLLNPSVPRDLETITLKCLQKDPARRYLTSQDLADDLTRFLDDQPITARPAGPIERARAWMRRHPTTTSLLAVTFVAAATLLAFFYHSHNILERAYADSLRRQVDLTVSNGARRADDGDLLMALPWFAEALRLDSKDPGRESVHRMRFAAALAQCPRLAAVWSHRGNVTGVAFRWDNKAVATAGESGRVHEWNPDEPDREARTFEHGTPVKCIAYRPKGDWILIVGGATVHVWDPTGGTSRVLQLVHPGIVNGAVWTSDGTRALTACSDGSARVWKSETRQLAGPKGQQSEDDADETRSLMVLPHGANVRSVAVTRDGTKAATGGVDGLVRVWDLATGKQTLPPIAIGSPVMVVAFDANGKWLLTAGGQTARLWDAATGEPDVKEMTYRQKLTAAALSDDGRYVATVSVDGTGGVWDTTRKEWADESIRHSSDIFAVAFSSDGKWVATASDDNTARVWNSRYGTSRTPRLPHAGTVNRAVFSPDGRRLLTAGEDGLAKLWELAAPTNETESGPPSVPGLGPVASRDGKIRIVPNGNSAQVTDAKTGEVISPALRQNGPITRVALSPDATRAATASTDRTARIWDWRSGTQIGDDLQHGSRVDDVVFSPDGRRVATGSDDNTVRVWDAVTTAPLTPPLSLAGSIYAVRFSPDGRLVLAVGHCPYATVWDATGGEAIAVVSRNAKWVTAALADVNATAAWELTTDVRPLRELTDIAQWLSGHQVDFTGGLAPLDARTLREIGQRVRGQ